MDQLINLFLSNPLFIIIGIFALISFMSRISKAGQTNQRQEQQGQREPNKEEPQKIDWRDIFNQEEEKAEPSPVRQEQVEPSSYAPLQHQESEVRNDLYDRLEEMKTKKREAQERVSRQKQAVSAKQTQSSSSELSLNFKNVTGKEAMKAVVWAEVLGSPRSRKPHKSFAQPPRKY